MDPINYKQFHTVTKTQLVFIRQLVFGTAINEEIENYNYQPILNIPGTGFNLYTQFDNGGTKVVGLDDWSRIGCTKPTYLEKIQQLIVNEWTHIDPEAIISSTTRINLNVGLPTNRQSDIHQDIVNTWTNEWSALVYLNESDGPTEFVTNKIIHDVVLSVPFKSGRLVIFPSVYAHRGSVPTVNNRCTINYIFNVDTKLNEQVLKR